MCTAGTQGKDTQQCARQGETKTVQIADLVEPQRQISSDWHIHERTPKKSGGKVGGSPPVDGGDPGTHGGALLDVLAVQRYVQPLAFLFLVDAQANGHIDDLEDRVADDEAVNNGRHYGFRLREDASGLTAI